MTTKQSARASIGERLGRLARPSVRRTRRVSSTAAIALTTATFVLVALPLPWPGRTVWTLVVAGLAIVVWVMFGISAMELLRRPSSAVESDPLEIDEAEVNEWQLDLSPEVVTFLLQMLTYPRTHTRRVSESVAFVDKSIKVISSMSIDVPEWGAKQPLVLPAHYQRRGRLVDQLRVFVDDRRTSTLSQRDTVHILVALMDRVIGNLRGRGEKSATRAYDPFRAQVRAMVNSMLASNEPKTAAKKYDQLFSSEGVINTSLSGDPTMVGLLLRALTRITEEFPVLVAIPADPAATSLAASTARQPGRNQRLGRQAIRVRVERLQSPVRTKTTGLRALVFEVFYVSPPRLRYSLRAAGLTRSYHLEVTAPEGMYFHNVKRVARFTPKEAKKRRSPRAKKPRRGENVSEVRLQRVGHYYLRSAKGTPRSNAQFQFRERTPGSLTRTLIWSGLISAVAVSSVIARSTDLGSLLLVLGPAIFAGISSGSIWQSLSQLDEPFSGRLSAKVGAALNVALGIAAIILSSFRAIGTKCLDGHCAGGLLSGLTLDQAMLWVVIIALSLTNTLTLLVYSLVDTLVEKSYQRPMPGMVED